MTDQPQPRERSIIEAFVNLSNELVDDYDVVEMLTRLTLSCVDLLGVTSAGLMLRDTHGVLHLAASSSEDPRLVDSFRRQRLDGPCLEAYESETFVSAADVSEIVGRWPQFAEAAVPAGVGSAHAFPMRLRAHKLGALALLGAGSGALTTVDRALAQALVHVASVAVVNQQTTSDWAAVTEQLDHALTSRIILEQAKGVLSASGDLDMAEAFAVMRRYAHEHRTKLTDVASAVAERRLHPEVVLQRPHSSNGPTD